MRVGVVGSGRSGARDSVEACSEHSPDDVFTPLGKGGTSN